MGEWKRGEYNEARKKWSREYYHKVAKAKLEKEVDGLTKRQLALVKHRFGLDEETYRAMIKTHSNKCAICGEEETLVQKGKLTRLSIDHCHSTGKVRGLLCSRCNHGIGEFRDSPDLLEKAIDYLKQNNKKENE